LLHAVQDFAFFHRAAFQRQRQAPGQDLWPPSAGNVGHRSLSLPPTPAAASHIARCRKSCEAHKCNLRSLGQCSRLSATKHSTDIVSCGPGPTTSLEYAHSQILLHAVLDFANFLNGGICKTTAWLPGNSCCCGPRQHQPSCQTNTTERALNSPCPAHGHGH